ncbi:MAG: acyl-CoA thioesterase [Gemmatimonadales bacterium]
MTGAQATDHGTVTTIRHRVDYSETDQQGVVYHARYLVWLDVARTEHLRQTGLSYRELEVAGFMLMVSGLAVRYRRPARYDDWIRVRVWVRAMASRRVSFGYAIENEATDALLATASTDLHIVDRSLRLTRFPDDVAARLLPVADPVRL